MFLDGESVSGLGLVWGLQRMSRTHLGGEGVSGCRGVTGGSLGGALTMKTDLTSNHLKMPGSLYAVVYTVLSIHMFCKGNTHGTRVRRRSWGSARLGGHVTSSTGNERLTGHAWLQSRTQDTRVPCFPANGAHVLGIWQ